MKKRISDLTTEERIKELDSRQAAAKQEALAAISEKTTLEEMFDIGFNAAVKVFGKFFEEIAEEDAKDTE